MARKKVNVKFLIALTAVLGGLALAAAAAATYVYSQHTSAAFIKKSAEAQAKGDLPRAAAFLGIAANKDVKNKDLFMRAGDLFERCVKIDPVYMGSANAQYRRVLDLDPTYQPAVNHLLDTLIEQLHDGASGAEFFAELKRMADQAVTSDRSNPRYKMYGLIATLEQWIYGAGRPNSAIDKAIEELSKLAEQNPQVPDGAFYASQAQLRTAADFRSGGQTDRFHQALDAIDARHKAAVAARADDPEVQWRAAVVFGELRRDDDRADRGPVYDAMIKTAIDAARASVKPSDPVYGSVQSIYVEWLRGTHAPADQITNVYRQWAVAQPHDARARYELANYLGAAAATRAEAMDLLTKPVDPDPQAKGYAILRVRGYQRGSLLLLNTLRAQDASAAQGNDRTALLAAIDADLPKIASMGSADDAAYLKLLGKSQMLHNNPIEAIKSFERANTAMGKQIDLDLWAQLQNAYLLTNQTGTAERMMEDLLTRAPGYTELRIKLAALYIGTGQYDKAAAHVKIAQVYPPKDAALAKQLREVELELNIRQNNSDAGIRQQITALPEATAEEQRYKARKLAELSDRAEAARLYHAILVKDPGDPEAVVAIVNDLMKQNNRAQASELVSAAIKARPEYKPFIALRDRVLIATPQEFRKYQDDEAAKIADPMARALAQAALSMERGDFAAADKQLVEAGKLGPNDARLLMARIQFYLVQRKFDEATPWVERAVTANADRLDGLAIRTQFALQRKDAVDALKWANLLVTKYGEFASSWSLFGQAQQAAGQYREALAGYEKALDRQSANIDAIKGKIACLEATGDYAEEKNTIDQARRLAPGDLALRDQGLNWELHHGDPDLAVTACEDILKKEPENATVYAALGQAAVSAAQSKYAGDPPAALRLLTRAKDVLREGMVKFGATPSVLPLYAPMAMTLDALGDPAAAEVVLNQYAAHPNMKDKPDALRELARLYERHGREKEAETAWRTAYERSSRNVDIELSLAQFLLRQGRRDESLKILSEANADNPQIQNQRIETYLSAKRIDDAEKLATHVYGATPTTAAGLFYRGLIRLSREQFQPAITDFTAARDKDSRNPTVQLWLARALMQAHRTDEATSLLEDALRRNPSGDDARNLLLDAYEQSSPPRWDDFDRVLKEALGHPSLKINPIWHQRYARALSKRGQFDAAKQEIAAAQKLAPNSMPLRDEEVNILVQAKDWPAVLSETDQQLASGYKEPFVYGKRGIARAGLGDKATAIKEFETAIAGYQSTKSLTGLADIIRTIGQTLGVDEALSRIASVQDESTRHLLEIELYGMKNDRVNQAKAAESALQANPPLPVEQRAGVLRTAADAYLLLEQWGPARRTLEELVTIHPNDVKSLNDLAYLIATVLKSPIDAKPYSKRAYDIAKNSNPSIVDTHGWVLTQCGGDDLKTGVDILQHLVDSNQDFTVARYHLAVAYLRQGGWQRAGQELAKVQQQMELREKSHQPVSDELKTGVPKTLEEVRQKSGQARGMIAQ